MTQHLSGPELERVAGGGEPPSHAAACSECDAQVAAIAEVRARYLAAHPAEALVRAACAGAVAPEPARHARDDRRRAGVRAGRRGAAGGPAARRISRGADARLGCRARHLCPARRPHRHGQRRRGASRGGPAVLRLRGAGHRLLLLGIDDSGTISRYAADAPLAPGRGQLPVGLRLDSRRGEERLVAVFGREGAGEDAVRAALAGALAAARSRGGGVADMRLMLAEDHATIWYRKP